MGWLMSEEVFIRGIAIDCVGWSWSKMRVGKL
jgi:hypothetical protein